MSTQTSITMIHQRQIRVRGRPSWPTGHLLCFCWDCQVVLLVLQIVQRFEPTQWKIVHPEPNKTQIYHPIECLFLHTIHTFYLFIVLLVKTKTWLGTVFIYTLPASLEYLSLQTSLSPRLHLMFPC